MRVLGSVHRTADKTYDTAQRVSDFKGPPGHLTKSGFVQNDNSGQIKALVHSEEQR